MFNFSLGELVVLGAIGLIFIGPKQLPQIAEVLGRLWSEFRKAINDVKSSVSSEIMGDVKKPEEKKTPKNKTEEPGTSKN
jgi:Sec-independent protein translocase protein TatA